MASMEFDFMRGTQKVTLLFKQPVTQAIDLGGHYRVVDAELEIYGQTGSITVAILTSMQNELDLPWATLGTFGQIVTADGSARISMEGALRYVRFEITQLTGVAYMNLSGVARTTV